MLAIWFSKMIIIESSNRSMDLIFGNLSKIYYKLRVITYTKRIDLILLGFARIDALILGIK